MGSTALLRVSALVAVLALSLGACGDDDSDSGSAAGSSSTTAEASLEGKKVCLDQYVTAKAVEDATTGFRQVLDPEGVEFEIKNPEGDAAAEQTIARQLVQGDCDLIGSITTPASQSYVKLTKDIPIVFIASSVPVEAGLIEDLERPGGNVTGVADPYPVVAEIDAMTKVMPDMKRVGLIFRTGDASGAVLVKRSKERLAELGIEAVEAPITNASEASQSAQSLVGRVDAIMLPGDSTTISSEPAIMKIANENDVPVFGSTSDTVELGAVLAGAYDYVQVGEEAGKLAKQILEGADPGTLPVVIPDSVQLKVNEKQAKALGLTIPQEILDASA